MADWGNAFSAAMKAGSGLIDAEMKKQNDIEAEQRAADTRLRLEERMAAIREATDARVAEHRERLRQSGKKADFEFDTNPENVKAKATAETTAMETTAPVKARLEREAETEKLNDPKYIEGLAKKARATHIESASSIAAANLSKFQLQQLQEASALQKEYQAAVDTGDKDLMAKLERKIAGGKVTDKKDAGDFLRAATQMLKMAGDPSTDPEEAASMKATANLMISMAGVDPSRAQAASGKPTSGAPYADGTRLKGKDGKTYVVRNGVPVPDDKRGGLIDSAQ